MRRNFTILLIFTFLSFNAFSQRRKKTDFKEKNTLKERSYYPSGQLRYYSKTVRRSIKPHLRILGKQTITLKEYYENGQIELKEKKVIPRVVEHQHLTEERHILKQKKEWRKYKIWNLEGDKIEKGRYNFSGDKRIVKYNYLNHKRVIIKLDKELSKDIFIKKKPLYKSDK